MSGLLYILAITWVSAGALVALCAQEFTGHRPRAAKLIVAVIAWPFALNKEWWIS
jgi:hypothetical protein